MECSLGWNYTCDFKIEQVRSASSIWNHKYDFRPKLRDTRFNYHFITCILKSPRYRTWSVQVFHWCSAEPVWNQIIHIFGISKSNKCAARVRFEITSMISDQNCATRGSITTLLHPFWNRPNTGLDQFKYFVDAVLSRFEIKFIHFGEGKIRVLETKVAKLATWYSLPFIFLQFDRLL